jgi:hypothetical protein
MKEWVLKVTVDTNDADYAVEEYKLNSPVDMEKFLPLIEMIKSKNGEFPRGEQGDAYSEIYAEEGVDEELFEEFQNRFIPYPDNGFHTIESMKLIHREIFSEDELLG